MAWQLLIYSSHGRILWALPPPQTILAIGLARDLSRPVHDRVWITQIVHDSVFQHHWSLTRSMQKLWSEVKIKICLFTRWAITYVGLYIPPLCSLWNLEWCVNSVHTTSKFIVSLICILTAHHPLPATSSLSSDESKKASETKPV